MEMCTGGFFWSALRKIIWERWDWAGEKLNWDAVATEASADPTESS